MKSPEIFTVSPSNAELCSEPLILLYHAIFQTLKVMIIKIMKRFLGILVKITK